MDMVIDAFVLVLIGLDFGLLLANQITKYKEKQLLEKAEKAQKQEDEKTLRRVREEEKRAAQWENLMAYHADTNRRDLEDDDA